MTSSIMTAATPDRLSPGFDAVLCMYELAAAVLADDLFAECKTRVFVQTTNFFSTFNLRLYIEKSPIVTQTAFLRNLRLGLITQKLVPQIPFAAYSDVTGTS